MIARNPIRRITPQAALLVGAAAVAWVLLIATATSGHEMDLALLPFLLGWTVMMAAMMLPSVAPVASLYARTMTTARPYRLAFFTAGYLAVWSSTGVVAFAISVGAMHLAGQSVELVRAAGIAAYFACGLYQLSPLKYRCLRHCRSPLSLLFTYASYRGTLRDLRAGFHHALYCLGCCWSLMVLLILVAGMNLAAVALLAAIVLIEKVAPAGEAVARIVGIAALALGVAAVWVPELVPLAHGAR